MAGLRRGRHPEPRAIRPHGHPCGTGRSGREQWPGSHVADMPGRAQCRLAAAWAGAAAPL